MIRLFLIDDHELVRSGLRQIFASETDITIVGEASTSAQATELLRQHTVDVVLLDISMPDKNGLETLRLLRSNWPEIAVLMLSMYPDDQYAVRCVKTGAAGYLNKNCAASTVIEAVKHVAKGKRYITPELAEQLATHVVRDDDKAPHEALSDREFQTLCMIAGGKGLTQIAGDLSLSPKTVSVYRARILEKMQLKNNAELTHYAMKHGLVE